MRPTKMTRIVLAATLFAAACLPATAQFSAPPNTGNAFKDTSLLKPPAGAKIAIYKFEDLECPACAHAYPIVHAAAERYKIPVVRHDFAHRDGGQIVRQRTGSLKPTRQWDPSQKGLFFEAPQRQSV